MKNGIGIVPNGIRCNKLPIPEEKFSENDRFYHVRQTAHIAGIMEMTLTDMRQHLSLKSVYGMT